MKSGFAILIGRSNVGKSTLLNALVGSKVAITTPKPQTTRFPIQGVVNTKDGQIVFIDTPGVLQKRDTLTKKLLSLLHQSMDGVDVVVYVVDATRAPGDEEKIAARLVQSSPAKKVLCINKIDQRGAEFIDLYRDMGKDFEATVEVSALRGTHVQTLAKTIMDLLPEGEPNYPEGQLTNLTNETLIAELIREKLFLRLHEELPYGLHVEVKEVSERDNGTLYIRADILKQADRYKPIIIGKGGRGLKEIGQAARKDLETITMRNVFLDLHVEVDPRWIERLG